MKNFFISCVLFSTLLYSLPVFTVNDNISNCDQSGDLIGLNCVSQSGLAGGGGEQPLDPRIVVTRLINVSLGFLGIIAVVIILYAGFKWMTAGGNTEETEKARKIIMNAVIGLAIIMSAWAISRYVLIQLYAASTGQQYGGTGIF